MSAPVFGDPSEGTRFMPVGTVKWFKVGYGFIKPDDGANDAFVHIAAVERAGFGTLHADQRICYDLEQDMLGRTRAVNLRHAEAA
jgi:cold shock protein